MESIISKTIWKIDTMHSEIQFKIKHLVISTVTGSFKKFDSTIVSVSDDFMNAKINFSADVNSIDTGVEDRDNHLKSNDFFNVEAFPKIIFESNEFTKNGSQFILKGNLTIKDVTRPVSLNVEYGGIADDLYNQTKAGFELTGKINRKDFNLNWNGITEAGGIVVGDEVKIICNVQFIKDKSN